MGCNGSKNNDIEASREKLPEAENHKYASARGAEIHGTTSAISIGGQDQPPQQQLSRSYYEERVTEEELLRDIITRTTHNLIPVTDEPHTYRQSVSFRHSIIAQQQQSAAGIALSPGNSSTLRTDSSFIRYNYVNGNTSANYGSYINPTLETQMLSGTVQLRHIKRFLGLPKPNYTLSAPPTQAPHSPISPTTTKAPQKGSSQTFDTSALALSLSSSTSSSPSVEVISNSTLLAMFSRPAVAPKDVNLINSVSERFEGSLAGFQVRHVGDVIVPMLPFPT